MPKYKNEFSRPDHYDHEILGKSDGKKIGTLRVKPIGLLWKPANQQDFLSVTLDQFTAWIEDPNTKAKKIGS